MRNTNARRWLAGFGVVGALVATAAPASAAPEQPSLGVYFLDSTIAADSPGIVDSPILYGSEPLALHGVKITYDFSNLAGKVQISKSGAGSDTCTPAGSNRLVCSYAPEWEHVDYVDEWGASGLYEVNIAPADGVKDGVEGTLKVSFDAAGFDTVTHESRIRIGEGVDLAAGAEQQATAQPGGKFTSPATVRNVGETTVTGTNALFFNDYAIRADKQFSNCTYVEDELRSCYFDQPLAAGKSYTATLPYALGADTYAPGGAYGEVSWLTAAEFEDFTAYTKSNGVEIGKPGNGGELTLAEVSSASARRAQADTDPSNNWSHLEVTVTGKNGADLSALGASISGEAGKVVPATIGFQNNGPATIDASRRGGAVTSVDVKVPTGTTAVTVPEDCVPFKGDEFDWENPGKAGATDYRCYSESISIAGEKRTFDFGFRIDQVIADATGQVTANPKCECESYFSKDLDSSNDIAKILVNATGNGGDGDGGDGGTGGGDGGLPITGASAGLMAGVGVLLLGAGAVGFVLARRRRMRFVA
ncbi:LPXTG cell wall anchor domain-containing protein [Micromonospora sp. NPDC049523]|uniref:LPXTG cell wall anchor domain-containing protein n=1 Tax=Micromonospora sp. NPDC049523 TaxID=3155921 RepID=UPI0034281E13